MSTERLTQARNYLKRYLESEESDQAMFLLGMTFSEEAQHDSALVYFTMLPDSVDAYLFHRGRTEYFIGMWGRAEEHLLLHRELFPASPYGDRATFILASINFRRREFDQALDFWSELVALYPHSRYAAAAQKGIGDVYFELRHYKKALDAYTMVDTYNPSVILKSQSYLMMYETGFYLKKYASLLGALTAYVTDYPESPLVIKTRLRVADILFTNMDPDGVLTLRIERGHIGWTEVELFNYMGEEPILIGTFRWDEISGPGRNFGTFEIPAAEIATHHP